MPVYTTKTRAELPSRIPILIVTATTVERDAVLQHLKPLASQNDVSRTLVAGSFYYVGRIAEHDVVFLPGSAGSGGRDGSGLNVADGLREWRSDIVVMAGIAFGKSSADQIIGDVLISSRIFPYEVLRVGETSVRARGGAPEASRGLYNAAINLGWTWRAKVGRATVDRAPKPGPLLSGPLLVDNEAVKALLFEHWPDAIGGEMEGYGVQSAADRVGVQWILAKAICDWAESKGRNKAARQKLASENAASFLSALLTIPNLHLDALPRGGQVVADSLAALRPIIRGANEATSRKAEAIGRMLAAAPRDVDGKIDLGVQKPIVEMEERSLRVAVEAELNAYNDACLRAIDGSIDRGAFDAMFGQEIQELVEEDGFHRTRLHPRTTSPYNGIWNYYDLRIGASAR